MVTNRPNLTSAEIAARIHIRARLGLPRPGPGGHQHYDPDADAELQAACRAHQAIAEHVGRYTPADDTAARLAMTHRDGYIVIIDGHTAHHMADAGDAARAARAASRFARILPLAECWDR